MTEEVEAVETGPEDAPEIEAPEVEVELDDEGNPVEAEDEDAEDYEHNGKTYKVPKALKEGELRQKDYTQKTMEVAEIRKAVEAQQAAVAAQAAFVQTHAQEVAKFGAADTEYRQWEQWIADNPNEATPADYHKVQTLKEAAARQYQVLGQLQQQSAAEAQQNDAKALSAMRETLTKDLPGYSPETESKIFSFATADLGYRPEEVAAVRDPRIVKTLHLAMLGKQATAQQSAAKTVQAQQATQPVAGLAGSRASVGSSWMSNPKTSPEEFARRRNEELAKKGRR
ncbi:MAG: hypothetical protein KBD40_14190 [Phenylobacterium sp.]|nr:hypothetical protein [Phenylobacterium sp.]